MKCANCGLHLPPQYKICITCGSGLIIDDAASAVDRSSDAQEQRPTTGSQGSGPRYTNLGPNSGGNTGAKSPTNYSNSADYSSNPNDYPGESYDSYGSQERSERYDSAQRPQRAMPSRPSSSGRAGRSSNYEQNEEEMELPQPRRRSKALGKGPKMSSVLGIVGAVVVLLVSAGATIFFLTKPPDDQHFLEEGQKQLANGQYAFAEKSLNSAAALKPKDPKVFLLLARAYVGCEQLDKAWDCISHAQQLGAGVATEPTLASDLANYYRQHQKYQKAIELLRPLAKADVQGKKAELADLDALWGDEALRDGDLNQALSCWEEVRDLRDGSRFTEAEARLSTIYGRLANTMASKKDDKQALNYINKLNNIAQNSRNYEMAADIYERSGQLELAIDQLRKAITLSNRNVVLDKRLSGLLNRRGKELLDQGNSEQGLAYLQQAKEVGAESTGANSAALKSVSTSLDGSGNPKIGGDVWNATEKSLSTLTLRADLVEAQSSKVLWTKEQKLVDDFTPPLGSKDSKPFEFIAGVPVKMNAASEFRMYIDGQLYKAYPLGKKSDDSKKSDTAGSAKPAKPAAEKLPLHLSPLKPMPDATRDSTPGFQLNNAPSTTPSNTSTPEGGKSSEEKTMKDLDF